MEQTVALRNTDICERTGFTPRKAYVFLKKYGFRMRRWHFIKESDFLAMVASGEVEKFRKEGLKRGRPKKNQA